MSREEDCPEPGDAPEGSHKSGRSTAPSRRWVEEDLHDPAQIRSKALTGVALVAGRDGAVKILGLVGSIVFARLLSPSQFGTVAFGLTILTFGQVLSDGGMGVSLIRRQEKPDSEDLRVVLGYQLVFTVVLALTVAGLAAPLGTAGLVTAVMMIGLPPLAFRTPSLVVLERQLDFGPLVRVEIAEQAVYYLWGIVTVALGAGVWGLATASIVKSVVGTLAMLSVSPVAGLAPGYSWKRLRPMLGFGVRFQAVVLVNAGGTQLLNVGVATTAGLAVLGLWTLAWRLLQVPFLLFGALWRVSYPATARLLSAGESARWLVERGLALAAVGTGVIVAPFAGAVAPLIPAVFGPKWASAADILPPILFAIQVSGPVSVATVGYLYAVGDTGTVLRATTVAVISWPLVTLPLLGPLGPVALGLGGMVAAFLEAVILSGATRRRTGASFRRPVLLPWVAASTAGALGWGVSQSVAHGFLAALLGALVAASFYAVPVLLLRREAVLTIARLVSTAFRGNRRQDFRSPAS